MSVNAKTKLLEYIRYEQLPTPFFETIKDPESPSHVPIFHSKCYFEGKLFQADGRTKRKAEVSVCEKIIADFYPYYKISLLPQASFQDVTSQGAWIPPSPKPYFEELIETSDFQTAERIILLDAENITLKPEQLDTNYDTQILAFVAKNTTKESIFNLEALFPFVHVFVSDRVGRDAADFLLAFYAGKLSMLHLPTKIYILTKDHYGEHLETFLDHGKYVCRYQDCFE